MTTFWTYDNLARITAGMWRVPPPEGGAMLPAALRVEAEGEERVPVLWHDTRELQRGQCYLAIKGDNFDGHAFVDQAFDKGAALAIVNADSPHQSSIINHQSSILEVEDTVKALQDLARAYRDELSSGGCKVIGVAGSNGKTTTRHLIHHVLTHAGKVGTQSPKSFNNHLGVPLTLLAARPGDDFVACEIGTNHPGEIDFLSAIACPDIAVITSIGEEHLEFFKDIEGVTKEELSIANHFDSETWCMVGPTVPWHNSPLEPAVMRVEIHAGAASNLRWVIDPAHEASQDCAMLAAWVARSLSITADRVESALRCATTPPGRWEKLHYRHGVTVINDAYNANLSSLMQALDSFSAQTGERKVFIFGEMYELGGASKQAHVGVGQAVCFMGIDKFIAIGEQTAHAVEVANTEVSTRFYETWTDDLPDQVAALLRPGDTVLLKASRGMRLERLIPAIEKRFGKAEAPQPVNET